MYTLFISTFDKLITIGLLKNGEIIDKKIKESDRNHSIYVMPMIEEILSVNEITTSYLNEIIVVNGPGSFTGVRLGVTIAKTLAYTLDIPIKTITSLESYAVSIESNDNKLPGGNKNSLRITSDLKGKFIGYFNSNNEVLEEFKYLSNNEYKEYIKDKKETELKEFNLESIYKYLKSIESINPHIVNPIYIKGIEALNGK